MDPDRDMPVLVADDFAPMLSVLCGCLAEIGFRKVDAAASGAEALARLAAKRYGLVISDWNLAPVTGLDLLRAAKSGPGGGATRFIVVTAESKTDSMIAARKAGVDGYLVKPFKAATLRAHIERALGRPPEPLGGA